MIKFPFDYWFLYDYAHENSDEVSDWLKFALPLWSHSQTSNALSKQLIKELLATEEWIKSHFLRIEKEQTTTVTVTEWVLK